MEAITVDVTGSKKPIMGTKGELYGLLNRDFMHSCIKNMETLGSDCCLVPTAADYLNECSKLMAADVPDEDLILPIADLAKRLQVIAKDFESVVEKMKVNQNSQANVVKQPVVTTVTDSAPMKIDPHPFSFKMITPPVPVSTMNPGLVLPPVSFSLLPATVQSSTTATATTSSQADEDPDEAQEKAAQAHEFVPVAEKEALFTTRCKIFQKLKDKTSYEVRGVGQLYIQGTADGSHRILVRADNSLGTVLLNMKITPDIPTTLNTAKKQVLTVDPHQQCPISFLVKTTDLAQTLFDTIQGCQMSA